MTLATIIRPYVGRDVTPRPTIQAGAQGAPPVRISIGLKGGTKTFSFSFSATTTTFLGQAHHEKAPKAASLKRALSDAAG